MCFHVGFALTIITFPVGIIHRDLSSKNVLINEKWEPKIADFGLAKSIQADNGKLVGMGRFGTDLWRAPEVWKRKEVEYSRKIDVYRYPSSVPPLLASNFL